MYSAIPDPYCYKGSTVLRNRLGIRNQQQLDAFEAESVLQRGFEGLPAGVFDPPHFRSIHRHLFQDVYRWAGKYRTVRISKGASSFCYPEYIAREVDRIFAKLHAHHPFSGRLSPARFAKIGAELVGELNAIHAIREGNGRTQMAFFAMMSARAGFPLDLERLQPAPFLAAMIDSFHGRTDALAAQLRMLM